VTPKRQPRPSKRKAKGRKPGTWEDALECRNLRTQMDVLERANDRIPALTKANISLQQMVWDHAAERDTARKELAAASDDFKQAQKNLFETRKELAEANQALTQYVASYQTYRGRIVDADRTQAQMEIEARG
jgi:uncharacterized protein (DUF3084 family)